MMRAPIDRRAAWPGVFWLLASLLLSLLAQAAPLRSPGGVDLLPLLPLITLYIWSARRPEFTPPWLIFIVGVLQDLLTGGPMGVWALSYLVAFGLARDRDEDGASDIAPMSIRFAVLCTIALAVAWAAGSAAHGELVGGPALIAEGVLSILVFPLFAWVFARRKERSAFS